MLEIITNKNKSTARTDLLRQVQNLDDWQARLVLSFIENLFEQNDQADEMEVAA